MCMGPPSFYSYFAFIAWVYPHVYGATRLLVLTHRTELGLSPCVWGHLPLGRSSRKIWGSIPMCMGPPFSTKKLRKTCRDYPHVYGANSNLVGLIRSLVGLSPCVFGHLLQLVSTLIFM